MCSVTFRIRIKVIRHFHSRYYIFLSVILRIIRVLHVQIGVIAVNKAVDEPDPDGFELV